MPAAGGSKRQRIGEALAQREEAKRRQQESANSKYAAQLESLAARRGAAAGGLLGGSTGFLDALTFSPKGGAGGAGANGRLKPTGLSRRT